MNYSILATHELKRRLDKADKRLNTIKTQMGLWCIEQEITLCITELKKRGELPS